MQFLPVVFVVLHIASSITCPPAPDRRIILSLLVISSWWSSIWSILPVLLHFFIVGVFLLRHHIIFLLLLHSSSFCFLRLAFSCSANPTRVPPHCTNAPLIVPHRFLIIISNPPCAHSSHFGHGLSCSVSVTRTLRLRYIRSGRSRSRSPSRPCRPSI